MACTMGKEKAGTISFWGINEGTSTMKLPKWVEGRVEACQVAGKQGGQTGRKEQDAERCRGAKPLRAMEECGLKRPCFCQ